MLKNIYFDDDNIYRNLFCCIWIISYLVVRNDSIIRLLNEDFETTFLDNFSLSLIACFLFKDLEWILYSCWDILCDIWLAVIWLVLFCTEDLMFELFLWKEERVWKQWWVKLFFVIVNELRFVWKLLVSESMLSDRFSKYIDNLLLLRFVWSHWFIFSSLHQIKSKYLPCYEVWGVHNDLILILFISCRRQMTWPFKCILRLRTLEINILKSMKLYFV